MFYNHINNLKRKRRGISAFQENELKETVPKEMEVEVSRYLPR